MNEICNVHYGSHIGEYTRKKIKEQGRNISWVAEQLDTSRQNLTKRWLDRAEWLPSHIQEMKKVLGDDFFDEFFEHNKDLADIKVPEKDTSSTEEKIADKGPGYSISIEIDPANFKPDDVEPLSDFLRKALEDFRKRIERD